jgi:hypothetical protein
MHLDVTPTKRNPLLRKPPKKQTKRENSPKKQTKKLNADSYNEMVTSPYKCRVSFKKKSFFFDYLVKKTTLKCLRMSQTLNLKLSNT